MKKAWIAWIVVFAIAGIMLFVLPVSYKIDRTLNGLIVYEDEKMETVQCSVQITGKYRSFFSKNDDFTGMAYVDGAPAFEPDLMFTFFDNLAATQYSGSTEEQNGSVTQKPAGCIWMTSTGEQVVISACYNSQTGEFTTDNSYKCMIYAPAENQSDAAEIVADHEWPGL